MSLGAQQSEGVARERPSLIGEAIREPLMMEPTCIHCLLSVHAEVATFRIRQDQY